MAETSKTPLLKVAVGGFGAIGKPVAQALDQGLPGLELVAVSASQAGPAEAFIASSLKRTVPVLPLAELGAVADVVVECAPAQHLGELARPVLSRGGTLIVVSIGALLQSPDLTDLAGRHGGRILVPSGALLGLDAVQAAAQGQIHSVRMVTRKPLKGLEGAPHLTDTGQSLENVTEAVRLFEGSAGEAIRGFPANLNVAIALSLAGVGPDKTHIEVWADPAVTRNTHSIEVVADSATLRMQIENIPSSNPKTGLITALSVISTLRRLTAPLVIAA